MFFEKSCSLKFNNTHRETPVGVGFLINFVKKETQTHKQGKYFKKLAPLWV